MPIERSQDRSIKRENIPRRAERLICMPSDYSRYNTALHNNEIRYFRETDTDGCNRRLDRFYNFSHIA